MKLGGRSAIITGASQGLGRAIAEHFVRAGAGVLLVARGAEGLQSAQAELEALATEPAQRVLALPADVAREPCCKAIVNLARDNLPGLCVLVNNAAIQGPVGLLEEVDWDAWVETVRVNLFGTVQMCRALVPHLREQRHGKIINLSGGGATAPRPRFSAYATAKAAVVRFTETLALELADTGVDVNAIAPGALNTRMLEEVLRAGPERAGPEVHARALRQKEQGGTAPDRGAELATFLASADSDGITGRLFSAVWDDWARLSQRKAELADSDVYTLRRITPEDRGKQWRCA
jgi:2-dehydro-3-deoxy-L-rhamnonate dehydrogenase (NAD+)